MLVTSMLGATSLFTFLSRGKENSKEAVWRDGYEACAAARREVDDQKRERDREKRETNEKVISFAGNAILRSKAEGVDPAPFQRMLRIAAKNLDQGGAA